MTSRFKELKRQFSCKDSKPNKAREEVVENLLSILLKPPSFRGYVADINSILEEHTLTQRDYLKLILLCFSHQSRSEEEALLIFGYLFYLKVFTSMITKINSAYINETLQYIAMNLEYEKVEADVVLMRLGDKGRKAYIILDGAIDVLIKTSKTMIITEEEYLRYMATLIRYKEYGLANFVLNENYPLYPVVLKELTEEMASAILQPKRCFESMRPIELSIDELLQLLPVEIAAVKDGKLIDMEANNVSCEEYINRLNVVKDFQSTDSPTKKGKKLLELKVYSYVIIASKGTGALFGQLALSNPLALRTATIITKSQSHFGILCKSTYKLCLAAGEEKKRRSSILFILSTKLFQQVSYDFMDKKFFNNFTNKKIDKGTMLIEEGHKPSRVCLLKEGVYEVFIKNSLRFLVSLLCEFSDKVKDNATESALIRQKEADFEQRCLNDKQFSKYYSEKRPFKINFLQCPEVIGLKDYTNKEGLYVFTVECKSPRGEIYEMTTDFYSDICQKDWSVKPNEKEFLQSKYALIAYHLKTIIYSVIRTYKARDKESFNAVKEVSGDVSPSKRMMRNTLVDIRNFQLPNQDFDESEVIALVKESPLRKQTSLAPHLKTIKKSYTFNEVSAPVKITVNKDFAHKVSIKPVPMIAPEETVIVKKPLRMKKRKSLAMSRSIKKEIDKLQERFDQYHTYYFSTANSTHSTCASELGPQRTIQKINLNKLLFKKEEKKMKDRTSYGPLSKTIKKKEEKVEDNVLIQESHRNKIAIYKRPSTINDNTIAALPKLSNRKNSYSFNKTMK